MSAASVPFIGDDSAVMHSSDFVDLVSESVPEAGPTVREHLEANGRELQLHVLIGELRRLAVSWFDEGSTDPLQRLLAVLDVGLTDGDERVENAVAVSFVEDAAWWDPTSQAFIAMWPTGLAHEVQRQRNARS